jgi:UDP-N-acetyl-D-mannosaminuronic acid dehydrogenase
MLLAVSRVHETMPRFLVEGLKRRLGGSLAGKKVAVLGLTFKRDSDDTRDSLSYKLIRLLERELAHVARHDPFVPAESEPLESALQDADALIVATNHSEYERLLRLVSPSTLVVDPWSVTGSREVFAYADELALIRARP